MAGTLRAEGEPPPVYENGGTYFTVEVHHSGFFYGVGTNRAYLNEKISWFDYCKGELWSFMGIEEITLMLGYGLGGPNLRVYWLLPGKDLSDGLRIISSDEDTLVMKQIANRVNTFVVYYDHENQVSNHYWEDIVINPVTSLPKVLSPRKVEQLPKRHGEELPTFYNNLESSSGVDAGIGSMAGSEDDETEDSDFVDSDYEVQDDDDDLFSDNVDDTVIDQGAAKGKNISKGNRYSATRNNVMDAGNAQRDWDELSTDEDELELPESDEEGEVGKKLKSFRPEDMSNPIFKIGMKFPSVEVLRKAITEYSLKQRVEIKMPRNVRTRIEAHCAHGCPWYLYASFDSRVSCFLVKRYVGDHNCVKQWVLKRCTSKWLAEKYMDRFRADEKMTLTNFARTVQLDWNLTPSRSKLGRARMMAMKSIYGDEIQQFNKLWDYGAELRRSNPGSSFYLNMNNGCFGTLYMSLDACKRGFLNGCRPLICLDGCHIKTKFGGILLTAVGIDPNECIYPVAMAMVEVESLQSWKWFLETLKQDLGIDNTYPWTIMTDKQKGLIPAVEQVFPESEHRFCVRHLYSNFQRHFKGENLKDQLWACVRSSTVEKWNINMDKMKALNSDAYEWLEKMPPKTWVRAFFSEYPKCDILLNNSCEVFNKYILEAREMPILSMLQRIKSQLMTRHYNKQQEATEKWEGLLVCPKIRKKVAKNAEYANTCYVLPAGQGIFQVQDRDYQYIVDISRRHCDCRRWDLTGIPCSHAISCLRHERIPQESVLPHCYSIQAFLQAYGNNIWLCNDEKKWVNVGGPEILPPEYEKRVGRPKKARRKTPHEVLGNNGSKLSKHGVVIHCSHCLGTGHNIATCARKKAGLPAIYKTKQRATPADDPAWSQGNEAAIIPQEVHIQEEVASQQILSQLDNPMVYQLEQEATQNTRPINVPVPMPDSAYILSNIPSARPVALTTATKSGRVSKPSAKRKATEQVNKKKGPAAKKKKPGQ